MEEHEKPYDALAEFDSCPLIYAESRELIQEIDVYLDEQARPVMTAIKKYGWLILEELGKSSIYFGIRPPRP